jgi:transposase
LHEIGEETSKELELTLVHEIARKKYACRSCEEGVKTAAGPDRVIEKGQLGVGFLAHTLVERFGNHMPYHRLEKKYASESLDLSRTVLWRSAHRCAELLEPIYEQMKREVLASPAIHTDDTPVTLQDSKAGGRRQARVWIYRNLKGLQVFDFTESRARDGPVEFFGDYRGYIIADAYPGYDGFFGVGKATEVACWAHARRKYVDAEATDPELAKEAVRRIGELYGIERCAKDLEPDGASDRLHAVELAGADALSRGRPAADRQQCRQRSLRQVAVGRKNWMFIGNENGGRTAAVVYSLIASAKAIGVDPRMYLRDVLPRIAHENDVTTLTPNGWKQRWAEEVEEHRASIIERLLARSQGLT